jgi:hypothetical protein
MPPVRLAAKRDAGADAGSLTEPRCNRSRRACGAFLATRGQFRRLIEGRAAHSGVHNSRCWTTPTARVSDPTDCYARPCGAAPEIIRLRPVPGDQELVSAWRLGSPQRLDPRCAGRRENPSAIYRRCSPNAVQQRRVSLATFVKRHSQRLRDGYGDRFGIIGIDEQRTLALDGGAGEAGENEYAWVGRVLRGDVFLGNEVHSVPQRRHQANPRRAVEPRQHRAAVDAVDLADRCP